MAYPDPRCRCCPGRLHRHQHAAWEHGDESQGGQARWLVAVSERRPGEHAGCGGRHYFVRQRCRLQPAWTFKLASSLVTSGPGFGSLAASPIVANGVVYLQDLGDNVYAIALATGKLEWESRSARRSSKGGPNGVALAGGFVYGDTMPRCSRSAPPPARRSGSTTCERPGHVRHPAAGRKRRVYLASPSGRAHRRDPTRTERRHRKPDWRSTRSPPQGQARPLTAQAAHGRHRWWERRLGDLRDRQPLSSGRRGDRPPFAMLYTNSEVNLDAATGKLRWYYQGVANDFMDHDMQTSPIAGDHQRDARGHRLAERWAWSTR